MRIVGVKGTHDAAVAVIEDGFLLFSTEQEKLGHDRYATFRRWEDAAQILVGEGVHTADSVSVDGWKTDMVLGLQVNDYHEYQHAPAHAIDHRLVKQHHVSFSHCYNHVTGAYMTSPFAANRKDAFVIVWDGGTQPRLYHWRNGVGASFVGTLHDLYGIIYGIMGYYWGPFSDESLTGSQFMPPDPKLQLYGGYSMPGKLMGWIGLGKVHTEMYGTIMRDYQECRDRCAPSRSLGYNQNGRLEHTFCAKVKESMKSFSPEDTMATLHWWLTEFTIAALRRYASNIDAIINTGGCALNIKMNSALRKSFFDVWVPPYPNDCGNAIGAACSEYFHLTRRDFVVMHVFSGPKLKVSESRPGWSAATYSGGGSLAYVADVLKAGEVVVFLSGRAELGPRALGARSLLADPRGPKAKEKLNGIKRREHWRPVSPIALEEDALGLFGCEDPDPYMLFDHKVPESTKGLLESVVHVDGTARLQTATVGTAIYGLLVKFKERTGIGVLCNTSANWPGKGFFDSLASAQEWAEQNDVLVVYDNGKVWKRNTP